MTPLLTALIVGLAAAGIFALRPVTAKIKTVLNQNSVVDFQIKFQSLQLILTAVVLLLTYLLNPENFARFFRMGDVNAHISKITWLGVTGNETWLEIALTLGLYITIGTGIFMFFQLKKAGVDYRYFLFSLLWSIPFSMANAFSEEAIFRIGIVSPLYGIFSVSVIVLISGVVFGAPHYFGMPSGIVGALMAGFLGWLLAMSLVETQGLLIAWAIHFAQDVVIITSMILMSRKLDSVPA
ncbi:MAG: CPBP family intramembrane metalloprotease [Anaerolineales bacterium]|uniref:CPBP family intramembrane glutamic endopeptidase n=1 Tax=Candidatus Villigracilis proximus TaxID=3140683 RepID=UPI003134A767|nr:CPBP family intramembrane metalloprotease [Anaerolineales bacterium]